MLGMLARWQVIFKTIASQAAWRAQLPEQCCDSNCLFYETKSENIGPECHEGMSIPSDTKLLLTKNYSEIKNLKNNEFHA